MYTLFLIYVYLGFTMWLPYYLCDMFFVFQYALENEELTQHLGAAKDAQRALTSEVS